MKFEVAIKWSVQCHWRRRGARSTCRCRWWLLFCSARCSSACCSGRAGRSSSGPTWRANSPDGSCLFKIHVVKRKRDTTTKNECPIDNDILPIRPRASASRTSSCARIERARRPTSTSRGRATSWASRLVWTNKIKIQLKKTTKKRRRRRRWVGEPLVGIANATVDLGDIVLRLVLIHSAMRFNTEHKIDITNNWINQCQFINQSINHFRRDRESSYSLVPYQKRWARRQICTKITRVVLILLLLCLKCVIWLRYCAQLGELHALCGAHTHTQEYVRVYSAYTCTCERVSLISNWWIIIYTRSVFTYRRTCIHTYKLIYDLNVVAKEREREKKRQTILCCMCSVEKQNKISAQHAHLHIQTNISTNSMWSAKYSRTQMCVTMVTSCATDRIIKNSHEHTALERKFSFKIELVNRLNNKRIRSDLSQKPKMIIIIVFFIYLATTNIHCQSER